MRTAATPPKPDRVRRSTPTARTEFSDAKWFNQYGPGERVVRHEGIEPIALMAVYLDTAQVFLRSIEDTDRQRIHDAYHAGGEWLINEVEKNVGTKRKPKVVTTGFQVRMQHPQPAVLNEVDSIMRELRGCYRDLAGSITRLDFAIDFLPLGGRTKEEVDRYIFAHLIMPNRRPGPLFRYMRNTTYWKKNAHLMQHSRDLVHYPDKPSKLPMLGPKPLSHVDSRLRGLRTVQADGFESLADAMNADPIEIVRRAFYFTDVDIRPHADAEALATHGRFESWRLRSRFIHQQQLHTAQRVKEVLNIEMPPNPRPPLLILPKLLWL